MYRLIMATGAVAAICFVVGCGSSGEEAASTPLTKAQFIKRADEICETVRKQRFAALAKLERGSATKVAAGANEAAEEVVAPSLAHEAQELIELEAPSSEKAKLANLTSKLAEMSEAFAREGSGVQAATALLPRYEREAAALDLDKCMQP